jgi:hypothetical protein
MGLPWFPWAIDIDAATTGITMRWLLLFLIVLNVVVLLWFSQQQKAVEMQAASAPSAATAEAPGIRLLAELPKRNLRLKKAEPPRAEPLVMIPQPEAAEPAVAQAAPASAEPAAAAVPGGEQNTAAAAPAKPVNKDACGFLGPFAEPITVRQIASRLKRSEIDSTLYSEAVPIDPVFWVHLRPAASRAEALAMLRRLHAERIDAFIVAEGEDANAISLGFFKNRESADAVRQQRIEQGYDARMVKKERHRDQYWAVVQPQGWSRVDDVLLAELRAEYGEFTRRTRKCSFVASYRHFE